MARGKVQMRRIENPVHRQVTFCKRRGGLLKKAKELSVLCDAQIGIIIFSSHGKLYELSTNGTMDAMIERYKSASGDSQSEGSETTQSQEAEQEAVMLKQEINLLQKGLRYMYGNHSTEHMKLEELHILERYLEIWMCNIRSAKMEMIFQEIQSLKSKEGILKAANELLQEKIEEQNGLIDVSQVAMEGQNGHFGVPYIADIINPLTLISDYTGFSGSEIIDYSY
ncbi:hypothetical protein LUZ60_015912 [Juncus effusus]|nr:hypothetical protein LUZ60_015912 [Juncus effusus]